MYRFVLVDKQELRKGEREEAEEHGFSPDVAHDTALDHISKKDPHYYSRLQALGLEEEGEMLEEWNDSIFTKEKSGGRLARVKRYKRKHPGRPFTVVGGGNLVGGPH